MLQILRVYRWREDYDGQRPSRWLFFSKRSQNSQGSSHGHDGVSAGGMAGEKVIVLPSGVAG